MRTARIERAQPIHESGRTGQLAANLERLRRSLCAELSRMIDGHRADGMIDLGFGTEEMTLNARVDDDIDFTVIEMKSRQVANIDWALRQLEQGAYGRCIDCQAEISWQRLEAIPFARRCTGCQAAAEG